MNKVFANAYERACDQQHIILALLEALKAAELYMSDELAKYGQYVDGTDAALLTKIQMAIDLAEER